MLRIRPHLLLPRPRRDVHGKDTGGLRIKTVKSWPVWQESRLLLAVLAVVEALALAVPVLSWSSLSRADLDLGLALASLSLVYSLVVAGWEKARRHLLFDRNPAMTPNLLAMWCFASAILLPPAAAAAVTAVAEIGGWLNYNPAGTRRLYRFVYHVTTSVLGATAASLTFRLELPVPATLPIAAGTCIVVGSVLTIAAMCASGQFDAARGMLHPKLYRLEIVAMTVAVAEFAACRIGFPILVWLSLPLAVAIQRYFTRMELRSRPVGAPPMDQQVWLYVAKVVVDASTAVTVVRIQTNDKASAGIVAMVQSGCDAIGTYGANGLALLLLDCPPAQGDAIARRLRSALHHHNVLADVASASTPRDGQVLEDLLAVSEAELVLAKAASNRPASSS
jgi:hypothetical protein